MTKVYSENFHGGLGLRLGPYFIQLPSNNCTETAAIVPNLRTVKWEKSSWRAEKGRQVCSFLRDINILIHYKQIAHEQAQWGRWGSLSFLAPKKNPIEPLGLRYFVWSIYWNSHFWVYSSGCSYHDGTKMHGLGSGRSKWLQLKWCWTWAFHPYR